VPHNAFEICTFLARRGGVLLRFRAFAQIRIGDFQQKHKTASVLARKIVNPALRPYSFTSFSV